MAMATGGSSDLTAQGAQWLQGAKMQEAAVMQMTKAQGEKKETRRHEDRGEDTF